MSLGDSIGSSLGRAIGAALSGGGWSPLSLFQAGEQGLAYDAMDLSSFWPALDSYLSNANVTPNASCGYWTDARSVRSTLQGPLTQFTFTAQGTTPPTTNSATTFLGTPCVSATFPTGGSGYAFSRAVGPSATLPLGAQGRYSQRVALSRALTGGEQIAVYSTGTIGSSLRYFTSADPASSWIACANNALNASASGSVYLAVFINSALSSPITVYVTDYLAEKVVGNHAYQSTDANRPILRGTPTGANLVTNGDFATAANWTPGAGWAIGSGVATATASSAALTHTLAATSGRVYRVRYTMTRSAGTLTPSFGGVTLTARSLGDTYEEWITASSTAALVFTGSAFTGTLDDVAIHDCSADVVSAPYGLQMGTISGVGRWMQTAAVFAHDSDWSVCVGIRSYAFADGVYPYGVATVRGGTSDTEGFILAVASGASVRTRAYSTETGFTKTLSAATPYVLLAAKQQSAHVRTAWVSGQIEESDASAFATTPAATSNQSARFGLNYSTQFMPMIWYGGVLIGRELNTSEKAQLRQWVSARTPGTTL